MREYDEQRWEGETGDRNGGEERQTRRGGEGERERHGRRAGGAGRRHQQLFNLDKGLHHHFRPGGKAAPDGDADNRKQKDGDDGLQEAVDAALENLWR